MKSRKLRIQENYSPEITQIIVFHILVRNEWTELSCTSEAAPEELEEHSMVAYKVQTHHNQYLYFNPLFYLLL